MRFRELHYRREWRLSSSPEALWPFLTDTNRLNRDLGLPAVEAIPLEPASSPGPRRRLRLSFWGIEAVWDEEPFEWVRPSRYGVSRRYLSGLVAEVRVLMELAPISGGGTHLTYQIWVRPRTLFGRIVAPLQVGLRFLGRLGRLMSHYDRLASSSDPDPRQSAAGSELAPGGRARLAAARDLLIARGVLPDLVDKLAALVELGDPLILARIRPYALADRWGVSRRTLLALCLMATRAELLDFRWEVLCPLCRGPKQATSELRLLRADVHCDTCNISFTANFDRFVEVTFRPNPRIRQMEAPTYCIGGPQVTPHIVLQQLLPPGVERTLTIPLEDGRYRLRTLSLPGGELLFAAPDGHPHALCRATSTGWPREELHLARHPTLTLENGTEEAQLFILERMAWSDQAATAADVTVLQLYRDLFAGEALRPGEEIAIGSVTFAFTDLRGSTRLYREMGDAPAFGRVMRHFDVLRDAIAVEEGALVKTAGDAVMAVFRRPIGAVRAMLAAQARLADHTRASPLALKVGIHSGPCIAVTQNGRLDYFGSTVNLAARLEQLSSGDNLIISESVRTDPEVMGFLDSSPGELALTPFETLIKGFEAERFQLWQVARACPMPENVIR